MMKKKSIAVLKQLFACGKINDEWIEELKKDERKGVQHLIKSYERKQRQVQALEKKCMEMSFFEQQNYANGCEYIAGVDEAGRGPLAGPVVAAAVILTRNFKLLGLDDSKQLNEAKRTMFYDTFRYKSFSIGLYNIYKETLD